MDVNWVADGLAQFLRSPMWTTPISNFVDDNCIFFNSEEEMKLEYTPIHKQFQELVDTLLTGYIGELVVSAEDALDVIKASNDETHKRLVEYLTYLDDFASFKKLMEKRNVELEVEAIKELNIQLKKDEEEKKAGEKEGGDEEYDLALQESRALAELIMKEAEMEDLELQRALALSLAMEQERLQREEEEKKKKASAAAVASPASVEVTSPVKKPIEVIQQETMEARVKNLEVANKKIAELGVAPLFPAPTASALTPAPAKKEEEAKPATEAPAVVRLTNDAPTPAPTTGGLAPIGRKPIGEGFKVLPPISFKQLQDTTPSPAPTLTAAAATERKGPTQEEIRRRAEELRKQRDLIIAMKKKERNDELEAATGKSTQSVASTRDEELARQKQMAIEIARRFRDDLVGESRK